MLFFDILIFIFLWFTMFLWHELCHGFECWRQNHWCESHIVVDFKRLGMRCEYSGYVSNPELVSYAGGVYSSLVCFSLAVVMPSVFLVWCFLALGWVQLVYGIFEGCFIRRLDDNSYYIGRYSLYVVVLLVNMFLWWWLV